MIRVGFTIIDGKTDWMGGINYLKNLLYALSQVKEKKIQPVLFFGEKMSRKLTDEFEGLAEIHYDSLFDRKSLKWFLYTFLRDVARINPAINEVTKKYDIQAFSHSFVYGPDINCVKINWIPDFQHLHLPKLYSKLHLSIRDFRLRSLAQYSDVVILSSYDAFSDFQKFTPQFVNKAKVVHFVSQTTSFDDKGQEFIFEKYNITDGYFFLPNQFWVHKNHKAAFMAIKRVKEKYPNILLLCTGYLNDTRDKQHIIELRSFIDDNNLGDNIKLLGLVPFTDVLLLMKYSIAIINPSNFEGWSSTVEEAKSMQKYLILSDIPVHREQDPAQVSYFKPDDSGQLSEILVEKWNLRHKVTDIAEIKSDLVERTLEFGERFQSVVVNAVS